VAEVVEVSRGVVVTVSLGVWCVPVKCVHLLRRNWRHGELLPDAQYRQVRVVLRKQVLEQRRMPSVDHVLEFSVRIYISNYHAEPCLFSVDHVLEFSVRIYISDYHAQPCLFDKRLHVLRRNWRHGELLPDAQYPQVRVM
jgi:hypothetical protein